jgi:hypothetical protein
MLRCRDESSPSRGDRVGEVGGRWSVVVILILSTDFLPQPFFRRQRKSKATPSICWPKRVAANENRQPRATADGLSQVSKLKCRVRRGGDDGNAGQRWHFAPWHGWGYWVDACHLLFPSPSPLLFLFPFLFLFPSWRLSAEKSQHSSGKLERPENPMRAECPFAQTPDY